MTNNNWAVAQQFPESACKTGPFAVAALALSRRGLAVVPLGGEDGRHPLVHGWSVWKKPPGATFIIKMVAQHPDANIGISCGPSHVTVIDIDNPLLLDLMIERFGDTPLKTHTPRGGIHLWYRSSGEGCLHQLREEGFAVDIKGISGLIVAPPSIRWDGEYAGRPYEFMPSSSWNDLACLPTIHPDALNARATATADNLVRLRAIHEGVRNKMLFAMLLRHARGCDDVEALHDAAQTINADFDPPLGDREVLKTVLSAWKYEAGGQNWAGKEPRVYTLKSEWERLVAHPNGGEASFLCQHLRFCHWAHDTFAISPKAMAGAESIPGWTDPRKYRRARDALIELGILEEVHQEGQGAHTPSLFRFVDRTTDKGAQNAPNIIKTPSLPFSPA